MDSSFYDTNQSGQPSISIDDTEDSKKARKRQLNKESALRSRMKKKQYYESMESEID